MKISELIEKLKDIKEKQGDLPVYVEHQFEGDDNEWNEHWPIENYFVYDDQTWYREKLPKRIVFS